MESKTRKSKKNQGVREDDSGPELTKEETKIAKFLRLSCPSKQGSLQGMKVNFFVANKLIDSLVDSQWGPGSSPDKAKKDAFFSSRSACVNFMQRLFNKQYFYRAVKIYKEQSADEKAITDKADTPSNARKRRVKQDNEASSSESKPTPKPSQTPSKAVADASNAKRKFKLDMHEDQKFVDGTDPYVWVYDPTSTKTYVIGSLLILGAISICLFPLWPSQVREGVYYVSLVGASFLGAILSLAVVKYIIFGAVWLVTFGSVRFWLFPNLTEDVGFLESFIPVYKVESASSSQKAVQEAGEPTSTEAKDETVPGAAAIQAEPSRTPAATPSGRKKSINVNNEDDGFELVNDDEIVKS